MTNIMFKEGIAYESSYGCAGRAEFTPIIMVKENQEFFIQNKVKEITRDGYSKHHEERNLNEIERIKKQLLNNDGKFLKFHAREENPFKFIQWVKDNNYTFEIHGELFYECNNDSFVDFHGNVKEYSAAFHYRIYDVEMIQELKNKVSECKSYVKWLRNAS
ncbi:MAG TPA: hypothetical protein DEG71_05155 [Clostridiales bacterium]|nr:hypothetical protein [Clostridiales bacterium]